MRDRLQAQAALAARRRRVRLPRHAGLALSRGWPRSRWRSSASRALRRRRQLRARRRDGGAAARVHPARCRCRGRRPRSPTASPAGAWPRRRRSSPSRLLWPAPARDPLRRAALVACRELAARLRSEVACLLDGEHRPSPAEHDEAVARAEAAVAAVHRTFFATPYRPTGLSTSGRAVVRLVDELGWLNAIIVQAPPQPAAEPGSTASACAVKTRAAAVLERGADLLEGSGEGPDGAHDRARRAARRRSPRWRARDRGRAAGQPDDERRRPLRAAALVSALDPELPRPGAELRRLADRRQHRRCRRRRAAQLARAPARPPARRPAGTALGSAGAGRGPRRAALGLAAQQPARRGRARPRRPRRRSLRRPALVLGRARHALGAALERAQHRAERRAQPARHAGRASSSAPGCSPRSAPNTTLLWFLLPLAILFAGFAPAAISFAAGQAAFTLTLVILFNILQPAGWRVGLLRFEDVALGCAVSVVVGLLFWPRGAAAALGQVAVGGLRRQRPLPGGRRRVRARPLRPRHADPARAADEASRAAAAAAAARRRVPRLPRRARREAGAARRGDRARDRRGRPAARGRRRARPVASATTAGRAATARRRARSCSRAPASRRRLVRALRGQPRRPGRGSRAARAGPAADGGSSTPCAATCSGEDGRAGAVAVRIIWTGDHLDAARRLQAALVGPARSVTSHALGPFGGALLRPRAAVAGANGAGPG